MEIRLLLLISILLFSATKQLDAKSVDVRDLNAIEEITVQSQYIANGMKFNVTLPASYQSKPDKKYFVLLNFHPESQPYLAGLHYWLSHNGEWPWLETIIVTPAARNQNFTKLFETMNSSKGGGKLLDFLEKDLLAMIDKKYRTNGFRIINGFRGDGTLSLYVLFNRPEIFNAYIVSSPNLANDYAKLMSTAKIKVAKLNDKPYFLFMSTGDHPYEQADLTDFNKLSNIIKRTAPKKVSWKIKHFDDAYFMSQPIMAIVQGIEALFYDIHHDLNANSAISKQGAQAIVDHYTYLSQQKYGFDVSAQGSLINLAKDTFKTSPNKTISILETTIKHYPNSTNALHQLAETYFELKQLDKAIIYQKYSLEKAKLQGDWYVKKQQKYLSKYLSHLTR